MLDYSLFFIITFYHLIHVSILKLLMLRVESDTPFKSKSTFLYKFKKIPNLVFGVLEIEHDATVFALVSVVCHLEQIKHLLLNVECHFPYFTLCHDQVIAVIDSVANKNRNVWLGQG